MATYYETSRSNYFLVKDIDAFKKELELIKSLKITTSEQDGKTYLCLISENENGFAWDVYDEVMFSRHLQDDSVSIIMGSGAEKLRYIHGYAIAFNNKGETKMIHLTDIYKIAEELGKDVKRAEY